MVARVQLHNMQQDGDKTMWSFGNHLFVVKLAYASSWSRAKDATLA